MRGLPWKPGIAFVLARESLSVCFEAGGPEGELDSLWRGAERYGCGCVRGCDIVGTDGRTDEQSSEAFYLFFGGEAKVKGYLSFSRSLKRCPACASLEESETGRIGDRESRRDSASSAKAHLEKCEKRE